MAITLEANYSKKLGLPGYSSHQYSLTVRTEVSDLTQVEAESARLYRQLQETVDQDIQNPGFLPGETNTASRHSTPLQSGTATSRHQRGQVSSNWNCSDKQQGLIEKLMKEHQIPFAELDELSRHRFKCGLKQLNKMSASGLIDELFQTYRSKTGGRR